WRAGWPPLAAAQAVLTVALVFAVDAFNAPDVPPQPQLQSVSSDAVPIATFTAPDGGRFALIAAQPGDANMLELTIRGEMPTLAPVWFGLIGVGADGDTYPVDPQQPQRDGERFP